MRGRPYPKGQTRPEREASARQQPASMPEPSCSPVVEFRQYKLHPGQRDVLIDLFDREFIESQEALGMRVIGQFRDTNDPDRFVWLRGFRDMATRARGLKGFYGGPVWQEHREVANATMIDSSNVLLLRPARPTSGFSLGGDDRLPRGTNEARSGPVIASIYSLNTSAESAFVDYFESKFKPAITDAGAVVLAYFVTEKSANNFPALPVREGENVFIWFAGFADRTTDERVLSDDEDFGRSMADAPGLNRPPQVLRLAPTSRSLLSGASRACSAMPPSGSRP
jgi:hypothetical protein